MLPVICRLFRAHCARRTQRFMKNKPAKYGFMMYKVVDMFGFVVSFGLFDGQQRHDTPLGATHDLVLWLLRNIRSDQHHHVFFDNFYTSTLVGCWMCATASGHSAGTALVLSLLHRGIHATGTLRANRAGLPREVLGAKWTELGRSLCMYRQPGLFCTAWRDVNIMVLYLSTVCTPFGDGVLERHTKEGGDEPVRLPAPPVAIAYRAHMGYVDRSDQAHSDYRTCIFFASVVRCCMCLRSRRVIFVCLVCFVVLFVYYYFLLLVCLFAFLFLCSLVCYISQLAVSCSQRWVVAASETTCVSFGTCSTWRSSTHFVTTTACAAWSTTLVINATTAFISPRR